MRYDNAPSLYVATLIHSLFVKGFADFLQINFPHYELKILRHISDVFTRKRVKHVNFLEREKKRLKREANAAKKAAKEAAKEAEEAKKRNATTTTTTTTIPSVPPPPTHSYSMRHRIKIAQYTE